MADLYMYRNLGDFGQFKIFNFYLFSVVLA